LLESERLVVPAEGVESHARNRRTGQPVELRGSCHPGIRQCQLLGESPGFVEGIERHAKEVWTLRVLCANRTRELEPIGRFRRASVDDQAVERATHWRVNR
jgi:hypothetical protein